MSWWDPTSWFRQAVREESRTAFIAGQRIVREEYLAELTADGVAAKRWGMEVTLEAIDYADSLDASNPAKAEVIAAFRIGVIEQTKILRGMMDQPQTEGAERQGALARPFGDVRPLETDSERKLPKPAQKALPNGNGTAGSGVKPSQPPPQATPEVTSLKESTAAESSTTSSGKRPRGRPRKYPKPEGPGTGTQAGTS